MNEVPCAVSAAMMSTGLAAMLVDETQRGPTRDEQVAAHNHPNHHTQRQNTRKRQCATHPPTFQHSLPTVAANCACNRVGMHQLQDPEVEDCRCTAPRRRRAPNDRRQQIVWVLDEMIPLWDTVVRFFQSPRILHPR
jgi:hypothetical protein